MVANRRAQLEALVQANPDHAFARYGLAMELAGAGERDAALGHFKILQAKNPDYAAAYQQAGQLLMRLERTEEARAVLQRGLEAARRSGDGHAGSEMQALLDEIGGA
ncbi:MAG: tetratricopeptide repeat protein [Terriglobales bacterium]